MSNLENFAQNGKKIVGIAANYKSLLNILNKPLPTEPGVFLKPSTSYIKENEKIIIPKGFTVNEEIELGVVINKLCKNVHEKDAFSYIGGYCVALDMTATDQMQIARSTGASWCLGKGFDTACPVSKFIPKEAIPDPHNVQLWCSVNGKELQNGNTNDLFFNIPKLISYVSKYMTLEPMDIIITGSPPGMGPVKNGDVITGGIPGIVEIKFEVEEGTCASVQMRV